ncbi:hypothetical protein BJ875DRAFT_266130 [Amylocarpus encephaloides]|uniref:Uncharacterized protein n=1 Tax=Amylocarpus encephaloides TaxID=45428 RepID=A0A9P8C810_9HELO|nr:hypothetical protein BJ875DRAFT_266130 [Amylocarpus encephaloides]
MCEILVNTKTFRGCPSTCNSVTKVPNLCPTAQASGTQCPNAKEIPQGSSTSRDQCPDHKDEGYSR